MPVQILPSGLKTYASPKTEEEAVDGQNLATLDAILTPLVGLSANAAQLDAAVNISNGANIFNVKAYGATGDGTTDDYISVLAALNACHAAGGGWVYFPKGVYLIGSKITIPNDNYDSGVGHDTINPAGKGFQQVPIRLYGDGADFNSNLRSAPTYGSILKLTYAEETPADNTAKIESFGLGMLEIDHLSLLDDTDGTTNFYFSTLTTIRLHHCAFWGKNRSTGITNVIQDAIVLGGTTQATSVGNTSGFQGYGTIIYENTYENIRRPVYMKTWTNSVLIERNTVWNGCGGAACFEVLGIESGGAVPLSTGAVFSNNLVESYFYNYAFKANHAEQITYIGNSIWDGFTTEGDFEYCYRFESGAKNCMVIGGYDNSTPTRFVSDAGTDNTAINFWSLRSSRVGAITRFNFGAAGGVGLQNNDAGGGGSLLFNSINNGTNYTYAISDTAWVIQHSNTTTDALDFYSAPAGTAGATQTLTKKLSISSESIDVMGAGGIGFLSEAGKNGAICFNTYKSGSDWKSRAFSNGVNDTAWVIQVNSNTGTIDYWYADVTSADQTLTLAQKFRFSPTGAISHYGTQTTLTGAAGSAICSMPFQGTTYKKVVINLVGYTDHATPANNTYTYPVAFTRVPTVLGDAAGMGVTATVSDVTKCVISGASTDTGVIILEGY